ncbi:Ankyrin repeat protein [Aphelenchoides avenae]|nr:Ankyrin repeat protein [Aphelenchus avenae]
MPQTVCASPLCTEDVEGVKHYKQVCHEDCRANKYVVANKRGDEALRLCSAFKLKGIIWGWKPGDNCHKCGCSYKEHMHILFTQRVHTLKVVDPEIVAKLQDVRSAKQAKHDQLEINKMHLEMLKKEERFITKIGIKLAWIVEQDAILPVNDFKKAFLERQIKAAELSGQTEQARKLKEELANYEKECELMKQKFMKKPTKLRLRDIDKLKEKLFALERSGETIKRLFDDMAEAEAQMRNNADFVFDAQQPVRGRVD